MLRSRACLLALAALCLAASALGACEDAVTRIGSQCCWGYPWDTPNAPCDSSIDGYGPDAVFRGYCKKGVNDPVPICTRCTTVGEPCVCGSTGYRCECFKRSDCQDHDPCTINRCKRGKCVYTPIQDCVKPVPLYGQCGGKDYTGNTKCAYGSKCVYQNEWYSQCLPKQA